MNQVAAEQLQSEKAKLQVSVTTLQSQSTSLTTQHTALQLANSQLVAEKEEVRFFYNLVSLPLVTFICHCACYNHRGFD